MKEKIQGFKGQKDTWCNVVIGVKTLIFMQQNELKTDLWIAKN